MARFKASLFLIVILLASFLVANSALEPVAAEPAADGYVFSHSWGAEGDQIRSPRGVAVASDGTVYIANSGLNRITKIAKASGGERTYFNWESTSGEGLFKFPDGIAVDKDGNEYVADSGNHRIQKFNSSGAYLAEWGSFGSGARQFDYPRGIAVDVNGNVYVADSGNHRIQKFSSSGDYLTQWGSYGSGAGQFDSPGGIAVDGAGNVYVAEGNVVEEDFGFFIPGNNRIQKFSSSGDFLQTWGWGVQDGTEVFQTCTSGCQAGIVGGGDGQFDSPGGIAVDGAGNVYVADSWNRRIQKFSSSGDFLQAWGWGVQDGTEVFQTCTSGCQAGIVGGGDGQFDSPGGIAVDGAGNVYVADSWNRRIQKFSSSGAYLSQWGSYGSEEGQFNYPEGIAVDQLGNVYVADSANHRIQKFSSSGAYLSQWGSEGGQFSSPDGIAVDVNGNVYVADSGNHRIQKFSSSGDYLTQWGSYGSGAGQFDSPGGIAVDKAGNVYVADSRNHRIQKFSQKFSSSGVYEIKHEITWGWGVQDGTEVFQTCTSGCQAGIVGGGDGQFDSPDGMAVGGAGNVYVADSGNHRIQKFSQKFNDSSGVYEIKHEITWGGFGSGAGQFSSPDGIAVDKAGNVYVADTDNNRIQKFKSSGDYLAKWGSYGSGEGQFGSPGGIAVSENGIVYVADSGNNRIQRFDSKGEYESQWGSEGSSAGQFSLPRGIAVDGAGKAYVADTDYNRIQKFSSSGAYLSQWGSYGSEEGQFDSPRGIAVDKAGNVYVADTYNNRIQKFSSSGAYLSQWGSYGSEEGQFSLPDGIAVGGAGNVYVADSDNGRIQKFSSSGAYLSQWGSEGSSAGQLSYPDGIAVDGAGNVYVADSGDNRIQKFSSSGVPLDQWGRAGSGEGQLNSPGGIAVDGAGNVYVADSGNNRIQKFSSSGAYLTQWGSYGGQFSYPKGIAVDGAGKAYVADTYNNRIQVFNPTYPTPNPISGLVFNGSFESSALLPGWNYGGSLGVTRGTRAVLGFYGLQLGEPVPQSVLGRGEAGAHQTFYVPATWSRPRLAFRYNMFVNDTMDWSDFFVTIQDGVGLNHQATVLRDGYQPCPPGPDDSSDEPPNEGTNLGWRSVTYDLSAFKGQHIRLVFTNRNLHTNSMGIWTHVDDVRVVDAGPEPPPPSPPPLAAEQVYLPVLGGRPSPPPCDPVPGKVSNQQNDSLSLLRPAVSDALQKRE